MEQHGRQAGVDADIMTLLRESMSACSTAKSSESLDSWAATCAAVGRSCGSCAQQH